MTTVLVTGTSQKIKQPSESHLKSFCPTGHEDFFYWSNSNLFIKANDAWRGRGKRRKKVIK